MKFKELYESIFLKSCAKHLVFDIDCDDCVDQNDIDLTDFDNDEDDGWDDEFCGFLPDEYSEDIMDETIHKKFVIRDKKKLMKFITNKEGFRIEMDGNKPTEVKMMPIEKRKRKLGQKRAAIKRKPHMVQSQRLRKKSLAKREQLHL